MSGRQRIFWSAGRLLWRDWRGGELGILVAAIVLAVAVVVGISVFVARLQSALESESTRFLAADLVVASSRAMPEQWQLEADARGMVSARSVSFSSMAFTDDDSMTLAAVKAVSHGYPLRGDLLFSVDPYGPLERLNRIPDRGAIWVAPRLFGLLNVTVGDHLYIGEAKLQITGTVRGEPDGSTGAIAGGPRVMMNLDDVAATEVVQPGSRVSYRLLLRGDDETLSGYRKVIEPDLVQGQRLIGVEESQPSIGRTLDRARGFLLLAGSLGVVLAAAAVALAARRFSERHTDYVAIMKSLGASSSSIAGLYGVSLCLLGILATLLGCSAGWGLQSLFFVLFSEEVPVAPGASGYSPYLIGMATALVCLLVFAWPPLRRLGAVPPLRVLRRDVAAGVAQRPLDYALGAVAIAALMWWYSGDIEMTAGLLAGLALIVGLGFGASRTLLGGSRQLGAQAGSVWRLAMAGLQRRGNANALQMTIFSIAIMLLLVLTMIRTSLIDQWAAQLPPGTPNHFVLNISPAEQEAVEGFFSTNGIDREQIYSMTRGRVMAVNGASLADWGQETTDQPRQREANFTVADEVPPDNRIVEGAWWAPGSDAALVSMEQEFAERIGARIGDRLTIRIAAESFDVTLANTREVDWQSLQPNFFVIFPSALLEAFPRMYMTSFFLPASEKAALNRLVREFPTLTIIELDVVIGEIQSIVSRVGQAIELVLAVILAAGGLVLVAGVQASTDVRMRESALLRTLGAGSGRLMGALWIEFTALGILSGVLAVCGAEVSAWILQTQALDLGYQPSPGLWPFGIAAGGLVVGGLGVLSCYRSVSSPPLNVLREI